MKKFICWLFGIQDSDHAIPETLEQWQERYPDETLRLNAMALHILPRLTALQAGTLRDLKRELQKFNATTRAWSVEK